MTQNKVYTTYLDYLAHHGVKGMRWGVWNEETERKYRGSSASTHSMDEREAYEKQYNRQISKRHGFDKLSHPDSISEATRKSNIDPEGGYEYGVARQTNCANCVVAYDLRRRGYDVAAKSGFGIEESKTLDIYGIDLNNPEVDIDGSSTPVTSGVDNDGNVIQKKCITSSDWKKAMNSIADQGNGARGLVSVEFLYTPGTGHVMMYEVVDEKVKIIDPQYGELVNKTDSIEDTPFVDDYKISNIATYRIDNKEPNLQKASRFVGSTNLIKAVDYEFDIDIYAYKRFGDKIRKLPLATAIYGVMATGIGVGISGGSIAIPAILAATGVVETILAKDIVNEFKEKSSWEYRTKKINPEQRTHADNKRDYIKAAKRYLKEHPNSSLSIEEIANLYEKEWGV